MGVDYGQGYYIQRPGADIAPIAPDIMAKIAAKNRKKSALYCAKTSDTMVGDICRDSMAILPDTTGAKVLEIFADNPGLYALPVISGTRVDGIIMKEAFYASLGTKYGFTLYHNRPVTLLMNSHPMVVTHDTSIEAVSKIAMTRGDEHLYDSIIVTKDGAYVGIVTIKDLLEKTTELKVNYAKHLNPLSGLPGNIIIEKQLSTYVGGDAPFTVVYIDIDNFKVYNDVYGFENGDRMLMAMVQIIERCTAQHCDSGCFAGHVGGDDFVIGIDGYDAAPLCEAIISMFREKLADFYSLADLEKGYVIANNRHGQRERFGLVTLSMACVSNKDCRFDDIFALTAHATMLKKRCKEVWDNNYVID